MSTIPLRRGALLMALGAVMLSAPAQGREKATFAGGCFWCVEADFDKVPGVLSTTSGYTGGTVPDPTYEQVSGKGTGHVEAVEIEFDPAQVSYEKLLDIYWHSIDPTTKNGQFCDIGSPYRTVIFTHGAAQLAAAKRSLLVLEKNKPFSDPVVTTIEPAGAFYPAEEAHQDYHVKNTVRYNYYRWSCGRDNRLKRLWGTPSTR
jgi:peptide-methionine (S)-S-oxide reductase